MQAETMSSITIITQKSCILVLTRDQGCKILIILVPLKNCHEVIRLDVQCTLLDHCPPVVGKYSGQRGERKYLPTMKYSSVIGRLGEKRFPVAELFLSVVK